MEPSTYLLIVFIEQASSEHARIAAALKALSGGDMSPVHTNKGCIALLFNSEESFAHISDRIEAAMINSDRFFLVEVGPRYQTFGLNAAAGWARTHLR